MEHDERFTEEEGDLSCGSSILDRVDDEEGIHRRATGIVHLALGDVPYRHLGEEARGVCPTDER